MTRSLKNEAVRTATHRTAPFNCGVVHFDRKLAQKLAQNNPTEKWGNHKSLSILKRAKGLEPSTFSLEGCDATVPSTENNQVTNTDLTACTPACTNSQESEQKSTTEADFTEALAMIARLPLSDAEKAEAVRRLLDATPDDQTP